MVQMTSLLTYDVEIPDWPTLTGRQDAEFLLCDEGDESRAERALKLAGRIGRPQMPWQDANMRGVMAMDADEGLWLHPTAVVVATRQSGKTLSNAELRIIAGAFDLHETTVYTAQRWLTAKAIYLRIKQAINGVPSLKRRVFGWTCSQGVAAFSVRHDDGSESTSIFITRTPEFRGPDKVDLVIYDEAYNLTDAEMSAISPTQLASLNPQTIYLSSAVNQEIHPNGVMLTTIRHRALEAIKRGDGAHGLYYREHCAPLPDPSWTPEERQQVREDPATWRQANGSFGVIQTESKVRKLQTELSAKAFEVEILGWGDWPPVADATDRPLLKLWPALADENPSLISMHPQVIAIDQTPLSKVWSIAGATRRQDGFAHVEIGYSGKAQLTQIVEYIVDVVAEADPAAVVIDQMSPAIALKPLLMEAGIEPVLTNASDLAIACLGFLHAAEADEVSHSDQKVLNDSVSVTVKAPLQGGRWKWGALSGGHIAHTMSSTLAHWGLLMFHRPKKAAPPPLTESADQSRDDRNMGGNRSEMGDFDPMTAAF